MGMWIAHGRMGRAPTDIFRRVQLFFAMPHCPSRTWRRGV